MIFNLLLLIATLYIIVSLWLSRGLYKLRTPQCKKESSLTFDILIAARNEEENLPTLFRSLQELTYDKELYTITVINDRSTDGTAKVLEELKKSHSNLRILTITETPVGVSPKKYAISKAINESSNNVIVTTDADSTIEPEWLSTMATYFNGNEHLGLLQGITKYKQQESISPILMIFQRVDFISHCIIAAAGIGINLPINSNANNFAYRRDAFNSIEGFQDRESIVSGDDDLLLQKIWKSKEWDLGFMIEEKASVVTQAEESWRGMFNQRMRWGSKTVHYENKQKLILGTIFLFYLGTLISLPLSVAGVVPLFSFPLLLLIKFLGELFFMIKGVYITREQELLPHTLWSSPIQLILVILSVFWGVFGTFTWKNQVFQREVK